MITARLLNPPLKQFPFLNESSIALGRQRTEIKNSSVEETQVARIVAEVVIQSLQEGPGNSLVPK